ncbi:MAG: DUF1365 domain-containing protein [Betaproteobacteria bacterium]|nr:DUF1365 domain-containing protein [Betaproteobacteria bacterium]
MKIGRNSALFSGRVIHQRRAPRSHRLSYRVFCLYLDLAELPELDCKLRCFAHNRSALLSFHDRDHGRRDGSDLAGYIRSLGEEAGIGDRIASIRLLCYPRLLGYVFNPLSVYFCHDEQQRLIATIYEVKNTFGHQHSYVFTDLDSAADGRVRLHQCRKHMHVSPFMPMDASYSFRLRLPDPQMESDRQQLSVAIRCRAASGDCLHALFSGYRRELSDARILATVAGNPVLTWKVIGAIHWHAARLWFKRLPVHSCPPPPQHTHTIIGKTSDSSPSSCQ